MYGDKDPGHVSTLTRRYSHMHARTHSRMQTANRKWELQSVFALGCSRTLGRVWVHLLAVVLQWRHLLITSCHVTASVNQLALKKEKKKRRKTAAKLRWQKQSPCPSTDYIRNSRDVNHALISSVLQRRVLCGKIAAACEAAFVRQRQARARASACIYVAIHFILQSFRCEPCQLYAVYSYPLCVSQMEPLSQRFV